MSEKSWDELFDVEGPDFDEDWMVKKLEDFHQALEESSNSQSDDFWDDDPDFDESWLVRDFEEIDEKLPLLAHHVLEEGINFHRAVTEKDPNNQTVKNVYRPILKIMEQELECYEELTSEEVAYYFDSVVIACELRDLVSQGVLDEDKNGRMSLNKSWKESFSPQ